MLFQLVNSCYNFMLKARGTYFYVKKGKKKPDAEHPVEMI